MTISRPRPELNVAFLTLTVLALLFRFWTSWCFFPLAEWNNVRLAPTFMLFFGSTPYPGINAGPVTTWIYGPVPLLMNAPAVFGTSVAAALLIAGAITLLIAVVSAIFATKAAAHQLADISTSDCIWAVLLCLALWPNPSLQYIQADNFAVVFGVASNFCLIRKKTPTSASIWLPAVCAALAVWSKQTSISLIPAQLLWLGFTSGIGAAIYYGAACLAIGVLLGGVFVAWFGLPELWLNLVRILSQLPFYEAPLARTRDFWMHLSGYLLLPALGCLALSRTVWKKNSPWLLPAITWLCLLPASVVSLYKIGGATNSLNGVLYLLPVAALTAVQKIQRLAPFRSPAWMALVVFAILTQQLRFAPLLPLHPATASLREADNLAKKFPDQLYFPWHPLVTFFSERRFYDVEDGYFTRQSAHIAVSSDIDKHCLPSQWTVTAVPGWRGDGIYRQFQPSEARQVFSGHWALYYWPPRHSPRKVE